MVSPDVQVRSELCGSAEVVEASLESSADGRRDDGRLRSRRADALMRIRARRDVPPPLSAGVSRSLAAQTGSELFVLFFCGQLYFN